MLGDYLDMRHFGHKAVLSLLDLIIWHSSTRHLHNEEYLTHRLSVCIFVFGNPPTLYMIGAPRPHVFWFVCWFL